ncbi:hypothetical protein RchiOBHm_Chr7g0200011 [Rosa chinensis]|uniref:BOD1/SHG1 domain-containing protein n=1 Tax=Rosa chinensis TaxID=74649 RepID=A0A2P6P7J5_ROSCH|nr:uncharacterized protein LOC112179229 [Rosa chinensis]PRQ17900.1 hypothetical protein RchiOBHm_Chr7g0200011 [Rosa chinensis]
MECSQNLKVSKEEVIAKLKDDGDFDRLRRKIIQKLKNNEELRENIISIVKQSQALNRPGAENMKPRQLSDDIYQEVGGKVMSQISDGLWGIIRSSDAMQSEISETVQSVYNKLANPDGNADGQSSTHVVQVQVESGDNGLVVGAASGAVVGVSDNHQDDNNHEAQLPPREKGAMTEHREMLQDKMDTEGVDRIVAPGVSTDTEHKQECDGSDEDPDVPPGFG